MTVAQPIKASRGATVAGHAISPRGPGAEHFRGTTARPRLDSEPAFSLRVCPQPPGGWRLGPRSDRARKGGDGIKKAGWTYITAGKARLTVVDADRQRPSTISRWATSGSSHSAYHIQSRALRRARSLPSCRRRKLLGEPDPAHHRADGTPAAQHPRQELPRSGSSIQGSPKGGEIHLPPTIRLA
jgi:hypothetical protein